MEEPESVSNEVIKNSTQSTAGLPMSEEGRLPKTIGDAPETTTVGSLISVEHGPSPIVTTTPDFAESTSSNIHPFKLERFTDSKGNTRTRVYVGKLRYCINTFDIEIKKDKKGVTTYGSVGSTNTGSESSHTHSGTSTVTIPEHKHKSRDDSSDDGLLMPDHRHEAGTGSNNLKAVAANSPSSGTTGDAGSHTHSLSALQVTLENHYHDAGGTFTVGGSSETKKLKMPSHTHGLSDITGGAHSTHSGTTDGMTSGTGGSTTAHTHDIGQSLTGGSHTHDMTSTPTLTITGYGTSGEPENIEGHTGGVGHTPPSADVGGTLPTEPNHNHSYVKDNHSHLVEGETTDVKDYSTNKRVTGNTGGIYGSAGSVSVTTGSGSPHNHPLPDLSTTTSEADRFVCIKTQGQGAGIIKEVEPTGFTALKDSDDKDTVVKTKNLPIGDTYGAIFLRWKLVLVENNSLDLQTINQADVTIYRHSDPTKTAEQLITDNAEKLTTLRGVDDENDPASGADMEAFKRGSETEGDRTAYYYVKIGNSYDPNAAGTNSKTIEQITYENVYWSPFLLPRYIGSIS